jgi:NAD(P)-dependent dehydrogenase (short-subunit alcohol dehydrogenase family)
MSEPKVNPMALPFAIIAGAGPGIGAAVARAFNAEGYAVALLARRREALEALAAGLQHATCWPVDLGDPAAVAGVIGAIIAKHGAPAVLHYNAARWHEADPFTLDPAVFAADLSLCATGALAAIQAVVPAMQSKGGGTLLFTGGGLALYPQYGGDVVSLTAGKAALRAMVLALAPKLTDLGLHAATVTVAGTVAPGTPIDPDRIAATFMALHKQSREDWQAEVVFDGKNER